MSWMSQLYCCCSAATVVDNSHQGGSIATADASQMTIGRGAVGVNAANAVVFDSRSGIRHSRNFSCGDHASDSACNLSNEDEELEVSPITENPIEFNHNSQTSHIVVDVLQQNMQPNSQISVSPVISSTLDQSRRGTNDTTGSVVVWQPKGSSPIATLNCAN